MARTFLNETFTDIELSMLQSHEAEVRAALPDIFASTSTNVKGVDYAAEAIAKLIFDPEMSASKIRERFVEEVSKLLTKPEYLTNCNAIVKELKSNEKTIDEFFKDTFKLSDLGFSEITHAFLMDLYKLSLSFGGGNTIGKGELCFAAALKDARLASHTNNNSKTDLVSLKGFSIELKADGGRLDGSGIRSSRVSSNRLFREFFMNALAIELAEATGQDASNFSKMEYWTSNGYIAVSRALSNAERAIKTAVIAENPFSRKSVEATWFKAIPSSLIHIQKAINSIEIADENVNINVVNVLEQLFILMYSGIYQYTSFGAELDFIMKKCSEMCNVCLRGNNVEDFITLDTVIRARIYMSLNKDDSEANKGYLVFTKVAGNDIFGSRIDYRAGNDERDWKAKANNSLKITPGNDNVRAAHAIHMR